MKVRKPLLALFLGLIFFVLLWGLGETLGDKFGNAGIIATFVVIGVCLFICQFLLSRGNPDAYRKDWLVMLALAAPFLLLVVDLLLEWQKKGAVFMSQGLGILIFCCGGTFVGAVAASVAARRSAGRR
jgi:hypothetical protein